jgi:hypothetical protein
MIDAANIIEVLDHHQIRYRKRGEKLELFKCLFCGGGESGDPKTMVVYLDGGNFKCLRGSCGKTGTFWAICEHLGENPRDFYKNKMEFHREQKQKPVYKKPEINPKALSAEAVLYLEKRGFYAEALEKCKVSGDESGNICFEYFDGDSLCFVKKRAARKPNKGEPKAWALPGGLRTLWGLEDCDPSLGFIVITFGEYDRMALVQSGVRNAVSVPSGDADTNWINICWEKLKEFPRIALWADNDEACQKEIPKIAERLGKHKILIVGSTFKDANEMLFTLTKEQGREQAEIAVYNAVCDADWYWKSDLVDVADIEYEELTFNGISSGFPDIDTLTGGFLDGRLTVWLGDSGAGKTTALAQSINHAIFQDSAVCAWSGEDLAKDFKYRANVNYAGYKGTKTAVSKKGTPYALVLPEWVAKYNDFVRGKFYLFDKYQVDENDIFETFLIAYERHGCTQFVLDNLMKAVNGKDSDQIYQRQARICDMFAKFCNQNKVHGHLIAHINKTGDPLEPPSKNSASGAKEITNIADTVIGWWRIPELAKEKFMNFDSLGCVLKNRVFGVEGNIPMLYDAAVKRFATKQIEMADFYGQNVLYEDASYEEDLRFR